MTEAKGALPQEGTGLTASLSSRQDVLGTDEVVSVPLCCDLRDVRHGHFSTTASTAVPPVHDRDLVPIPVSGDLGLPGPGYCEFLLDQLAASPVEVVPDGPHLPKHP